MATARRLDVVSHRPAMDAQRTQSLIKGDRHFFSSSEDSAIMKQILATHQPDGREVDCRSLLNVIEDIFHRATPTVAAATAVTPRKPFELKSSQQLLHNPLDKADDKISFQAGASTVFEVLANVIHRLSCEIAYKCSGGGDGHAAACGLFESLAAYTWEAKAVIALAAFAALHGEFWLVVQMHNVNPLAHSLALLKQLPDILNHGDLLKPRADAVGTLLRAMLDVVRCAVHFSELPAEDFSGEEITGAVTHIPMAVFWVVRSIVACTNQIVLFIGFGQEYVSTGVEAWELSSLEHKLRSIFDHLSREYAACQRHIDDKRQSKAYENLLNLFRLSHIDNMRILKAMIHSRDNLPLTDLSSKKRVPVDVLRRKTVILFISDLDISQEELFFLVQIYSDTHQGNLEKNYEIVWLPVIDRQISFGSFQEEEFNRLASLMPWFSLHHPSLLEPSVVKYIREAWKFEKKPMLVVLDSHGKVVCPNAHHMMWVWGSDAFPFTSAREEQLWKEQTWSLEFLIDDIDPSIPQSIREGKTVCLYGGENIDWIRRFTATMKRVATEAGILLEMVYVGKSNPKERVKKVIAIIQAEKLSRSWQDIAMMGFFWTRLESMWHSRLLHCANFDKDEIMQEVVAMLSFDGSDEGWALLSTGGVDMAKGQGRKMLDCFTDFNSWKAAAKEEGFVRVLRNALLPYTAEDHCCRLVLPEDSSQMRDGLTCAECKRPMQKYVLYKCCNY